jgi:hypothetical protein
MGRLMTYVLNRVTPAAGYTAAATVECPGAVRVNLDVETAGIFYELAEGWPSPRWRDEIYLGPGFRSLDQQADGIRVRSEGTPAVVTIAAYPPNELGGSGA